MKQVVMTFLGTRDYLPCNFVLNGQMIARNVRFVQEALFTAFCKEWTASDQCIIFLTDEANRKNWVDKGHHDRDGKPLQREGLASRIRKLDLPTQIITLTVPEGHTEEELWRIFTTVIDQVGEGDEIIVDITHGFRSLPLLILIILNYLKVLKNVHVKGVYYGAFEALGSIREIEKKNIEDRVAPIFDLSTFIHLFDWTSAIDSFLKYGNAQDITTLTTKTLIPILRETRGKEKNSHQLKEFTNQLRLLTELIQTSRGYTLCRDYNFTRLKELIELNKQSFIPPLNPLLNQIDRKIERFQTNDIKSGYTAVEWCVKHNLIPQGYTILRETMISEMVVKVYGEASLTDRDTRELITQAVMIKGRGLPKEKWPENAQNNQESVYTLLNQLDDEFCKILDSMRHYRNDINHAGYRDYPYSPKKLRERLQQYYKRIQHKSP